MKIVDLETFRLMPEGTVYSNFEPNIFQGLRIKDETWESDFNFQDLIGNIEAHNSADYGAQIKIARKGDAEIPLDFDCTERDGLFEDKQLFAVYSTHDVASLITRLQKTLF